MRQVQPDIAEQLWLFEGEVPDMAKLKRAREALVEANRAENTFRAYSFCWRKFERWCDSVGRPAIPASDETVSLFVTGLLADEHARLATATLSVSAINDRHRRAGHGKAAGPLTRAVLQGAKRKLQERPQGKAALTVDDLRAMVSWVRKRRSCAADRDAALLLLGFASGMRRSELVGLDVADVRFVRQGVCIDVRRSKNDQANDGRVIGIPFAKRKRLCPVLALRRWLDRRGRTEGPLFVRYSCAHTPTKARLNANAVNELVQEAAAAIGLQAAEYGAHSLRSGLVTTAAESGANPFVIMQRTGHKRIETVRRYYRSAEQFASDPLAKAL